MYSKAILFIIYLAANTLIAVHADMYSDCNKTHYYPNIAVDGCTKIIKSDVYKDKPKQLAGIYVNRGLGHWGYGELLKSRELYEAAIKDFNEAMQLYPNLPQAYINRAIAYTSLSNLTNETGLLQNAVEDHSKAIEIAPDMWQAYASRAGVYRKLGKHRLAMQDFDQVMKINPKMTAFAYNNRGVEFIELGKLEISLTEFDKAIRNNPKYGLAYWWRSIVHCRLGNINRSVADRLEGLRLKYWSNERLQKTLKKKGYYKGSIDGNFGKGSIAALRAYTKTGCPE